MLKPRSISTNAAFLPRCHEATCDARGAPFTSNLLDYLGWVIGKRLQICCYERLWLVFISFKYVFFFSEPKESAVEFVIYGILLVGVGILGLLGNVISIVVLTRPQMKSSINIILVGLVSCDSILIVTSILMFGIKALRFAHYHNIK